MATDCLTFSQGQTATLTAQFVASPSGMPVNVPDATIEIFGPSASVVLPATAMAYVVTGLYYYDYVVPNSLPVDTYTVRFSGTVLGTPTANSMYLRVVAPGSPLEATSQSQAAATAALERYIGCAQRIPVEAELARVMPGGTTVSFNWPRWNLTNPIIRRNDRIITSGYAIDYDAATLTFDQALHETDKVDATYTFRWFSQENLVGFLNDALSRINIEPPGSQYTLDNLPEQIMGVLLHGAASQAIQSMMFCLQFQKPRTVFGGAENAKNVFSNFETLKQNHEKMFNEDRRKFKIARYPNTVGIVHPEYTLPGGRCLCSVSTLLMKHNGKISNVNIEQAYSLSLKGPLEVLAFNDRGLTFSKVAKVWKTGYKEAFELTTASLKKIIASKDHLFRACSGYVPVSKLRQGDLLFSTNLLTTRPDRLLRIRRLPNPVPMYDMEVPETQNFVANGIICHNSRWFRYLYSSGI